MPTKNQAKTAIDAAALACKSDIDNILPVGINITSGSILFNPTKSYYLMLAPDEATLNAWATTIYNNLITAARNPSLPMSSGRRKSEDILNRAVVIDCATATFRITLN